MSYHGDIDLGDTIDVKFTSRRFSTGAPYTLAGSPAVAAYPDNSTTEVTGGITLTVDFDSRTGLNNIRVVATSGNGYATGTNYALVLTAGTVDSVSVVGEVVGSFSIDKRSALRPTTAGNTLDVNATGEAGIDWANVGGKTTTNALTNTTIATTQKVDVETIKTQSITCSAGVTVSPYVGSTGAAINGTNANTLSSHDPGATLGTSTLTQTQVTGGAYALDSASFAFNAALDFTTTQKAATLAQVTLVDTVTTYTGNTPQTGDSYARIGATGSGLTSLAPASTALSSATWTASRAGYIDNLNVGGNVASSAEVTAIQNNTRTVIVVPEVIERPDSGTDTYLMHLYLYDETGNMEAPDSAPTVTLVNSAGTDRSGRLGSTTGTLVATGHYKWVYTNTSTDTLEQLLWEFSVVEGGATRVFGRSTLLVDTSAVDFTTSDRTKLEAVYNKLPSKTYLTGTGNSDGDVDMSEATGNYPGSVGSIAGVTFPSNFASLGINASGHVSRVTLADTVTTYTGNTPQTGDGYAIVSSGTFGSAALKTLIDAVDDFIDTEVAAIKAKTDNLPAAPAAAGDCITAAGVRTAVGLGSANLDTQLAAIAADLPTTPTKNTALAGFTFVMYDDDHSTPATGLTVTAQRSIDGGSFASCTNSPSAVGSGVYKIDLSAADMNGDSITFKFSATGADTTFLTIVTEPT